MAPLVGTIGALQAMEAIKVLSRYGTPAAGKIVMYDAMTCQFREMKLPRNPQCEVCAATNPTGGDRRRICDPLHLSSSPRSYPFCLLICINITFIRK
jgi:hypothetical protein